MPRKQVLIAGASGLVGYAAMRHFGTDPDCNVIALSRYRAQLGRGKRLRRSEAIMNGPNPEAAIRALPGDELYYMVHETGPREWQQKIAKIPVIAQ